MFNYMYSMYIDKLKHMDFPKTVRKLIQKFSNVINGNKI